MRRFRATRQCSFLEEETAIKTKILWIASKQPIRSEHMVIQFDRTGGL
jgi:hypothetical protein